MRMKQGSSVFVIVWGEPGMKRRNLAGSRQGADRANIVERSLALRTRGAGPGLTTLGLLLTGMMGCAAPAEVPPRVLRIASQADLPVWDPIKANWVDEENTVQLVFEGLTRVDEDGNLRPGLATHWETSGNTSYTLHLRTGVRFHDGSAVRAGTVLRSWARALEGRFSTDSLTWEGTNAQENVGRITAVNDSTIHLMLRQADPAFPTVLASARLAIVADARNGIHLSGTGPWRLVSTDSTNGHRLVRNTTYWGPPPRADSLWLRRVAQSHLAAAFDRHEIDCALDVGYRVRRSLLARTDLRVRQSPPVALRQLALNLRNPALRDVRVRRAIAMALDIAELARQTGNDNTVPAAGAIPPGFPGYDAALRPYPYDPTAARQLLADAGFTPKRPLRVWVSSGASADSVRSVSYRIRDYLVAIDIPVEMFVWDGDDSVMLDGTVDIYSAVLMPLANDASGVLHTAFFAGAGGEIGRLTGYRNPRMQRLLKESLSGDPESRLSLLRQANRILYDDVGVASIWFEPMTSVFTDRISSCPATTFSTTFSDVALRAGAP